MNWLRWRICDLKSISGRNENVQYLWLQNKKEKKGQEKNQKEKEIANPRIPVAGTYSFNYSVAHRRREHTVSKNS